MGVLALPLHLVHRAVRGPPQGDAVLGMVRKDGDADAGADGQRRRAEGNRGRHRLDDLVRDLAGRRGVVQIRQHDDEFVPADARGRVAGAYAGLQAGGHFREHPIAGLVAVLVVDGLETVEIDEQQRHLVTVAGRVGQRHVDAVCRKAQGRQAGQLVVRGQVLDLVALPGHFGQQPLDRAVKGADGQRHHHRDARDHDDQVDPARGHHRELVQVEHRRQPAGHVRGAHQRQRQQAEQDHRHGATQGQDHHRDEAIRGQQCQAGTRDAEGGQSRQAGEPQDQQQQRPLDGQWQAAAQRMDGEDAGHRRQQDIEGRRPAELPGPPRADRQRDPCQPEQTAPGGIDEVFTDPVQTRNVDAAGQDKAPLHGHRRCVYGYLRMRSHHCPAGSASRIPFHEFHPHRRCNFQQKLHSVRWGRPILAAVAGGRPRNLCEALT
nr:hypothetical protein [Rubrivivax pictus]